MKLKAGNLLSILLVLMVACGTPKMVTSYRTIAEQAVAEGNFEAATENWRLYFEEQMLDKNEIAPEHYAQAAKMAFRANKPDLALSWYKQAQAGNYADAEMYFDIATIYKQQNNLSKELDALEYYRNNFQDDANLDKVNSRLFEIYATINNPQKAVELWPLISEENRTKEEYLDPYFAVQKQLDHQTVSDSLAEAILLVNPKHEKALEWLGDKYYHQAEDLYQREMKAYEKNHTRVQHIKLTKKLKAVTADFRKAADYFKQLWEINQDPHYATYLVNIYTRFKENDTANYYRKFLKK